MIRLTKRRRRASVLATGAAAAVLALGSVAWACTETMMGEVWICPTDTSPDPPCASTTTQSFTASSTRYSRALGLSRASTTFKLHYVSGHSQSAYEDCMNNTNVVGTFGNFTTSAGTASWKHVAITMPSTTGNYTECAVYPTTGTPTDSNQHVSSAQFVVVS